MPSSLRPSCRKKPTTRRWRSAVWGSTPAAGPWIRAGQKKLFGASWFRVLTLAAPGRQPMGAEDACRALADCYRRVIGEPKWRQYIELYRPDGTTAQLL